MKYFVILLIASFVFFGCDANDAGDNNDGNTEDPGNTGGTTDPGNTGGTTDPGNTGGTEDPGNTGGTTDPGSNGSTGPFEGLGLCVGPWGEVENGTSIGITGETYSSIIDQDGLQAIANNLAARYILCDDIEIDPESTFTKIGGEFTSTLEGNNRTISNLRIQALQDDHVGLFSKIGTDGEVRNLTLSLAGDANDPDISGTVYVGALAGENKGTITNVGVNGGYVKGYRGDAGGLVGYNDADGTIEQSYATSRIESDGSRLGGLVGYNLGTITASYATGTVTGTRIGAGENNDVGGLVGTSTGTITASYATGTVTGNSSVGGLVGFNTRTITASYATGTVTGAGVYIGGLVGNNLGSNAEITASYFDAETTEQSLFIGNESVADRAYYTDTTSADREVYTQANGGGTLIAQSNFPTWDFVNTWHWQGDGQWPLLQFQTTMTTQ